MKSYLKILIGNIILTGAYAFLPVPNNIINGGVTSTSLLISHYLNVDVGIISAIKPNNILVIVWFNSTWKRFFYKISI